MFTLDDIGVDYGDRTVLCVQRLTLGAEAFTVILGHNGSGKTTLMNLLARQMRPTTGGIYLHDRPVDGYTHREYARLVAYLPQRMPDVPGLDVRELCGLGRFAWRGAFGRWTSEDRTVVEDALEQTDMSAFATRLVDQLSGGERQRAWIAMLLAQSSPILLLDEPISALDLAHQMELLTLLRTLNREAGRGVVVILHDVNLAARFADRIIALRDGHMAFDGSPERLMEPDLLSKLYGTPIELVERAADGTPIAVPA